MMNIPRVMRREMQPRRFRGVVRQQLGGVPVLIQNYVPPRLPDAARGGEGRWFRQLGRVR